jgi:hypothetical protein
MGLEASVAALDDAYAKRGWLTQIPKDYLYSQGLCQTGRAGDETARCAYILAYLLHQGRVSSLQRVGRLPSSCDDAKQGAKWKQPQPEPGRRE